MNFSKAFLMSTALMATAVPAAAFESVRITFDKVTGITSLMTDPDRASGENTEQQRIIINGRGSLEFDKSVPEFANRNDLRIRLNMPRGVSVKRRNGRNQEMLSRAENGHAAACLTFAMRVLGDSEKLDLRIVSEATGVAAGRYKRTRETAGREILIVRLDEDHFEDVRCTISRSND